MSDYKPVKGDRVRVVYEGVVEDSDDIGFRIGDEIPVLYEDDAYALVSIEKIEPPVETFKPGDVVKGREFGFVYTIADTGYVSHSTGEFRPGDGGFTSEGYEKVNLG